MRMFPPTWSMNDVTINSGGRTIQMALMDWNSSFSVGVKAIDAQHMGLVQSLNDLHAAMMGGQAKTVTGPLLKKLAKYTEDHFAAEEAMLRRTQYPGFTAHHAKHVDLTNQVNDYVGRFERGESAPSVHLMTFLRDWLTTHIQKEDRDYSPWLLDHGGR
jgi:hemerythrin